MKKKHYILFVLFLVLNISIFSKNTTTINNSKNLISGKLNNGMKYFILKNQKPENRASLNLIVNAGSLLETEKEQGLAHFLEHMAFNGTTSYKRNDLVKYLQSLGLSFGGDLNAYTSFSETVYKLQVPTNNSDLEIGFNVLKEWASDLSLNPEDIELEKNIIIEEWRLRQGVNKRVGDLQKEILYGDSWYSKRYPIGVLETIKNANQDLLKGFYKKWYQPRNMSIVAVGDFNVSDVENLIKENFSSLKNINFETPKSFDIKLLEKNTVTIFTDKELTKTSINIFWKEKIKPLNTTTAYQNYLEKTILNSILNSKFSLMSKKQNSPFLLSTAYNFQLNKNTASYVITSVVKDEKVELAIEDIITTLKYIALNGVSKTTLEREKLDIINNMKSLVKNKESITNETLIESIRNYILLEESFLEPEDELNLIESSLNNINSNSIKTLASNLLKNNYAILVTSGENSKEMLPTAIDIENLMNNLLSKKNIDIAIENESFKLDIPILTPGSNRIYSSEENFKRFILSNGIEVLYKNTDFESDKISINLSKLEGSSSLDYTGFINSIFLPKILKESGVKGIDYNSLEIYFKGKNFTVSPFINDYTQGFSIVTDKENLLESLNFFRALVANPILDENIIESTISSTKELIKNREFSPSYELKKTFLSTLNSEHPRRNMLEIDDLNLVKKEELKYVFNKLFRNFNDYKMTVVGSIDESELNDILNQYFANLPVGKIKSTVKPLNVIYPKTFVKKTIVKGEDKKSTVILAYPFKCNFSVRNRTLGNAFSSLLDILLIEEIREKIGGVYTISAYSDLEYLNYGENYLQISFSTDTKRTDEIVSEVKKVISDIQKGEFPKNKISDIQKNYELNFETAIKTNSFWNSFLNKKKFILDYEFYTPMVYNEVVTFKSIVNFSNSALDLNNCIEIILLPNSAESPLL